MIQNRAVSVETGKGRTRQILSVTNPPRYFKGDFKTAAKKPQLIQGTLLLKHKGLSGSGFKLSGLFSSVNASASVLCQPSFRDMIVVGIFPSVHAGAPAVIV